MTENLSALEFIVAALATYRLSLLFTREDGPAHIFRKLRGIPPAKSDTHDWLTCFYCFSMTASGFVCLVLWLSGTAQSLVNWFLLWCALSAAAVLAHRQWTKDF